MYRYLKVLLKYSNKVFVLSYFPSLIVIVNAQIEAPNNVHNYVSIGGRKPQTEEMRLMWTAQ